MQEMNRRSFLKGAPLAFAPLIVLARSKNLFDQNQETNMVTQRGELDEIFDLLDRHLNFHKRQKEGALGISLPWKKSAGIFGDNYGIPKSYFSVYSYWDVEDTKLDRDHGISTQINLYLFPSEGVDILKMFSKKYQIKTGEPTRYEIPFNFRSSKGICDLYEEKLANKRFGRTRQVGISVIENRRIVGSVSIYRKYFLERRWDVITRNMEILNRKIGGGLSGKKGILSLI